MSQCNYVFSVSLVRRRMNGYSEKTFHMRPVKTEGLNFEVRHEMPSREVLRKSEGSGYKNKPLTEGTLASQSRINLWMWLLTREKAESKWTILETCTITQKRKQTNYWLRSAVKRIIAGHVNIWASLHRACLGHSSCHFKCLHIFCLSSQFEEP